MEAETTRTRVYLETLLYQALRLKAASTRHSMSGIVNAAVRAALGEDEEDLTAIADRAGENPVNYEQFLARLKTDGTI
jgi:hypothetical protein